MKNFKKISSLVLAVALSTMQSAKSDDTLDKLKASADTATTTLTFKEGNCKNFEKTDYLLYNFGIDTQTIQYSLQYKTFAGADAKNNPAKLNDWSSGYGMVAPYDYWYSNGLLEVGLVSADRGCYITNTAGVPTILEKSGKRIAYDITFKNVNGCVVIRTVALAGKDELYLGVFGKTASDAAGTLTSVLTGYPLGSAMPRDRVVYGENFEIKNGDAKAELKTTRWLLLSDKKKENKNDGGMLGVIYDKKTITQASVEIKDNYRISTSLVTTFNANEVSKQYCMIFTFAKITVEDAKKLLLEKAGVADNAFEDAFSGLPDPAM